MKRVPFILLVALLLFTQINTVAQNYTWVLEPQLEGIKEIGHFSDGVALFETKDNKFGYIDTTGKVVISAKYNYGGEFIDGIASVQLGNNYGYINKQEEWFDEAGDLREGLRWISIDGRGGYVDSDGGVFIEPQFSSCYSFSDGIAMVVSEEHKYGFINKEGEFIITAQYEDAVGFSEGYAWVKYEGNWYVIDKFGESQNNRLSGIQPSMFVEGVAVVHSLDEKFGYANTEGTMIIDTTLEYAGDFCNGVAIAKYPGYKYGILSRDAKWVGTTYFDSFSGTLKNFALIQVEGKWGLIDPHGDLAIEPMYDYLEDVSYTLFSFLQGGKYGYVDFTGAVLVEPRYDEASRFYDGIAVVRLLDKYGFIDSGGGVLYEPQFEAAESFSEDVARVKLGGGYGYVSSKGEWVIEAEFEGASERCGDGFVALCLDGLWGIVRIGE